MRQRRSAAGILLVLLLLYIAVLPAAALPADTDAVSLDILDPSLWTGSEAVLRVSSYSAGESEALYVSARGTEEETLSVSASFADPLDFSAFRELALSLHVGGRGECQFTVSFLSGGVYYNASTYLSGTAERTVYIPIPQQARGMVDALAFTVTRLGEPVAAFMVSSVSGDAGFSYAYMERFMSAGFTPVSGTMEEQEDCILFTTEGGSAAFYPNYIPEEPISGGAVVCLRIQSGHASGTVAVRGTSQSTPLALLSGEHTYAFFLEDASVAMQYVLEGVAATRESPVVITGAAIYPAGVSSFEGKGSITSCRSDGEVVTVRGTISSDKVVEHINGELALYIIPVWEDEEAALQGEPAATMSISTRFELTAVPEEPASLCKYRVMILSGEEKISVAPSVFLNNGASMTAPDASVTGIHGTDTVGIFESNVTSAVLDVYADRLLEREDVYGALLYASGDTHYYLDRSYIEELDMQIQFCRSSGTQIYLRFLTSDEEDFSYTAADQGSVMQLCALAAFLSERYQGIAGFVLGISANTKYVENTEDFANLAAVFSAVVQTNNPQAVTIVPVRRLYEENFAGVLAADPAVFLTRLSVMLSRCQAGSIMILYETGPLPQGAVLEASGLASIVSGCGHVCDGAMLFWQPEGGTDTDISALYESLCLEATQTGLRSVVLSLSRVSVSSALFEEIKETIFENTSAGLLQREAEKNKEEAYLGTYPLWDFTSSYDVGGWVAGGGFGRIFSTSAENGSGRVLQAKLETADDEAGILLCWLERPLDLTGDSVTFFLQLYDVGENASLSIVFGSGDSRAEYTLNVGEESDIVAACDLQDFASAASVEYVAVILRGAQGARLEISKAEICSMEQTAQQLQLMVEGPGERLSGNPVYYFIVVILAAATVVIFSVLSRRPGRGRMHKNLLYRR